MSEFQLTEEILKRSQSEIWDKLEDFNSPKYA
jgi:hypothetical protein